MLGIEYINYSLFILIFIKKILIISIFKEDFGFFWYVIIEFFIIIKLSL